MTIKTMEVEVAKALLEMAGANGKIFTMEFIKKDGTLRKANGRFNVGKYTNGGVRSTANNEMIVGFYDMGLRKELTEAEGKKAYRSCSLDRIVSVNGRGIQAAAK